MKNLKTLFSILFMLVATWYTKATIVTVQVDSVVNATTTTQNFDMNGDLLADISFTYLPSTSAFNASGKTHSYIACESIGGVNYKVSKIYNNKSFKTAAAWRGSTGAFMHHVSLGLTGWFNGKGNQYIGGRMIFNTTGKNDTIYYWFLVNMDAAASELKVIKYAWSDDPSDNVMTGTDGETQPTTGLNESAPITAGINVFPQPASGRINIMLDAHAQGQNLNYELYNLQGARLQQGTFTNGDAVLLPQLSRGIYLLNIQSKEAVLSRKIVIE